MKFFIFKEIEGMFVPSNRNLYNLIGKTHNVRKTLLDNIIEMLYHSHFKYSQQIILSDYLDEHKYGNDKVLITLNIRTILKVALWNNIVKHCTSMRTRCTQPLYINDNTIFIKLIKDISLELGKDISYYFNHPLSDPLSDEMKPITVAICNYIGIEFVTTMKMINLIQDVDFKLLDNSKISLEENYYFSTVNGLAYFFGKLNHTLHSPYTYKNI